MFRKKLCALAREAVQLVLGPCSRQPMETRITHTLLRTTEVKRRVGRRGGVLFERVRHTCFGEAAFRRRSVNRTMKRRQLVQKDLFFTVFYNVFCQGPSFGAWTLVFYRVFCLCPQKHRRFCQFGLCKAQEGWLFHRILPCVLPEGIVWPLKIRVLQRVFAYDLLKHVFLLLVLALEGSKE